MHDASLYLPEPDMIKPRFLQGQLTPPTINGISLITLALLTSSPAWANKEFISTDPLSIANVCSENGMVSNLKGEKDCIACHTEADPDLPFAADTNNGDGEIYKLFRLNPSNTNYLDKVLAKFCTAEEPPPDDNPTPEAGNGACGYASDMDYSNEPTDPLELCTSGIPSSVVLKNDGRYQWTCNGSTEGAKSQVCYTSNGKLNQAPLALLPGSTSVKSGKTVKLSTSGGNGKGKVKYSRDFQSGGLKCKLTPSGKKARVKVKGTGVCKVKATKAADKDYNDVQAAPITITVTP